MGLGHKSLADRLSECQQQGLEGIPVEELLGYVEDAAKAIDFLNSPVHQLESGVGAIGHCDIKPLNMLIVGGAVQVCDFGLAHIVGAARSTAAAMGTIAYVAPELLEGKPSGATDQYCLAISYYELRTGSLPYDQETSSAVMKAVIDGALNFSKLPEAEQAVVRRATAKDPKDRFPSAVEMVAALREAATGGRALPARRRSPVASMLKALAALVLLAAIGVGVWLAVSEDARNRFRVLLAGAGQGRQDADGTGNGPSAQKNTASGGAESDQDPAVKLATLFKEAGELATQNEWQSALQAYEAILAIEPANRQALLGRARCFLKLRRYDEAIAELRKVQPPHPETIRMFVEGLSRAGAEAMKRKSWEMAREAFRRALELDPANVAAMVQIGRACLELDLPDDAVTHFTQAIALENLNAEAHFLRGTAYLKKQQFDKALADFEVLMGRIDPDNRQGYASRKEYGEAYLGRGTAVRDEGKRLLIEAVTAGDGGKEEAAKAKIQEAVDLFTKGIRHDPKNPLLLSRRGTSVLQLGKLDDAVADLGKAIECGGKDVDLDLVYRGSVYVKMASREKADPAAWAGLLKRAKADFEAAAKANPRNADADYLSAECCVQLDDFKGAIAFYDGAIKKHAGWPDPWFTLKNAYYYRASCHLSADGLNEAANDFSQALTLPGDLPAGPARVAKTLHTLAAEFAKRKQLAEAAKWNQKAIELTLDETMKEEFRSAEKAWKAAKP